MVPTSLFGGSVRRRSCPRRNGCDLIYPQLSTKGHTPPPCHLPFSVCDADRLDSARKPVATFHSQHLDGRQGQRPKTLTLLHVLAKYLSVCTRQDARRAKKRMILLLIAKSSQIDLDGTMRCQGLCTYRVQ